MEERLESIFPLFLRTTFVLLAHKRAKALSVKAFNRIVGGFFVPDAQAISSSEPVRHKIHKVTLDH